MTGRPAIVTALLAEQLALRTAKTEVVRIGMGARNAARAARSLVDRPIVVAGLGGAVADRVAPGDVVVASEVRDPDGRVVPCPGAALLADALRHCGLTVHVGPVASVLRLGDRPTGVLAVDMESAWVAPPTAPFAVVRVISDSPERPLVHPGILVRGAAALATLRRCVPVLDAWANAVASPCWQREVHGGS